MIVSRQHASSDEDQVLLTLLGQIAGGSLDDLTLEAFARTAGVSRATAYRRFDGRDDLIYRSMRALSRTHIERVRACMAPFPTALSRIEECLVFTIREMAADARLRLFLLAPRHPAIERSIRETGHAIGGSELRGGQASGQLRSDVGWREINSWLVQQTEYVVRRKMDERQVRSWYRRFMVPVLLPGDVTLQDRRRLAQVLEQLDEGVLALRAEIDRGRGAAGRAVLPAADELPEQPWAGQQGWAEAVAAAPDSGD